MEKEIIRVWLTDSENIVAIREYDSICSAVSVSRGVTQDEDISVYHGHSWEEVFTVWFKDVIDDYFDHCEPYRYFDTEQIEYMRSKYNMFVDSKEI